MIKNYEFGRSTGQKERIEEKATTCMSEAKSTMGGNLGYSSAHLVIDEHGT
jgi:hypothetical protein